ncbi:hypothetical protein CLOM621_09088 [Clostridium sp. M62/1]|uniref:hypothetical protein n=1 Tax=Clostridium sp. M62/1 TaxID=411486 RepID=UPI0001C34FF1|nr:hypothetical protein [Clostridium sp. M62/1]EFE10646.1 hypothetical protein CLOM621_09108 [Clostridium sp. M62/1]EFE10686.1 hypothetical protein CLOM621_09088 [Clostridium sp. M62/1]
MSLFYLFDLLKKGWFSLPFPTPKNTYRGLILSIDLFYLFDLLKKGWFSLPFPTPKNTYRGLILSIQFIAHF